MKLELLTTREKAGDEKATEERKALIDTLVCILDNAADLHYEDKIMNMCNIHTHSLQNPLTAPQAILLRAIAPKVALSVFSRKFYGALFQALFDELVENPVHKELAEDKDRTKELLMCFAELCARVPQKDYAAVQDEIIRFHDRCIRRDTIGLYVDLIEQYCRTTAVDYTKHAHLYASDVLALMNDDDGELVQRVIVCLTSIMTKLTTENKWALVPRIRDSIENIAINEVVEDEKLAAATRISVYTKRVQSIKMFETKEGVKTLTGVILDSILHGSLQIRIDCAFCFKYLIDFSAPAAIKTEVIKICGALIRVSNDKFPPELKIELFLALRLMLTKCPAMVRAMVAQLQTTFLKAFADPLSTEEVRQVVMDNLLLLVKLTPKADPIVKDLTSQLEGDKVNGEQKMAVSQTLALVLREKAKTLNESIAKTTAQALTNIVCDDRDKYNDKIIVNCAVALAFLRANEKTANLEKLFVELDGYNDFRVQLGFKIGVLMSGLVKAPVEEKLHKQMVDYMKDVLGEETGLEEIDCRDITADRSSDDEMFRFNGALDTMGHMLDAYVRRFYADGAGTVCAVLYQGLTNSGLMGVLNEEEDFSMTSKVFTLVPAFIAQLAIPSAATTLNGGKTLPPQLNAFMKLCFAFLKKFYLDFENKGDGRHAICNLLQLTYNGGLDFGVSAFEAEVTLLTPAHVRDVVCEMPQLQGTLPQDFKANCADIIFDKN